MELERYEPAIRYVEKRGGVKSIIPDMDERTDGHYYLVSKVDPYIEALQGSVQAERDAAKREVIEVLWGLRYAPANLNFQLKQIYIDADGDPKNLGKKTEEAK